MSFHPPPSGLLSIAGNVDLLMTLEEIAGRWAEQKEIPLAPRTVAKRLAQRSRAIRTLLELPARPRPRTARQWETAWNRRALYDELHAAAKRLGWEVRAVERYEDNPAFLPVARDEENVLLVEQEAAVHLLEELRAAGLRLPFQPADTLLIQLAEDLFHLAADKAGHQPRDAWVDEAAPSVFAQDVLGLPFCPLVLRVLEDRRRR